MGTGSSRDRDHRRNLGAPTVRQAPQSQQSTAASRQQAPPMPYHLQQQFRQPPASANPAPQATNNLQQRPQAVQEGQKIKMHATVEPSSVHYEPENALLTFRVTSTCDRVTYEIHVAVRETIRDGKVIYTPNRPKLAPEAIPLEGPQDDTDIAVQIDLNNVTDTEVKYNKHYPKQRPAVIVIRYTNTDGVEHSEHTSVDLAADARRVVTGQVVVVAGGCYAAESLFGGEHEQVTIGSVMEGSSPASASQGVQDGGVSPVTGVAADDDDGLCVICLTLEKDTAVIPCRHLCLCKECAEQLMKHTPKCPVCRGPISQLLHMPK